MDIDLYVKPLFLSFKYQLGCELSVVQLERFLMVEPIHLNGGS